MKQIGIKVTFIDGSFEWYDPCEVMPDVVNNCATIENSHGEYFVENIESIEEYDLCQQCLEEPDKCLCVDEMNIKVWPRPARNT